MAYIYILCVYEYGILSLTNHFSIPLAYSNLNIISQTPLNWLFKTKY